MERNATEVAFDIESTGSSASDKVFEVAIAFNDANGQRVQKFSNVAVPSDAPRSSWAANPKYAEALEQFKAVRADKNITTTLGEALDSLASSLAGTTTQVVLVGHKIQDFDLKALENMGYGAEKLAEIFGKYGVKIVDTFDTLEAARFLRAGITRILGT